MEHEKLVKLVEEKVGISEQQAISAVDIVIDFLKVKKPARLVTTRNKAVSGEGGANLGAPAPMMGGLLRTK